MTRAKKQDGPNKRFSVQGWDASHYQKTEAYVAVIDNLFLLPIILQLQQRPKTSSMALLQICKR